MKNFYLLSFTISNMPEAVWEWDDILCYENDGHEISFFCRKYPAHNIQFRHRGQWIDEGYRNGLECFIAEICYEDYIAWTEAMKSFWEENVSNPFFQKYYVLESRQKHVITYKCRFSFESDEMKNLLINPFEA